MNSLNSSKIPFFPKNASVLGSLSFRNLNLTGKLFNLSLHQIHILIISLLEFSKCTIRPGAIVFCVFLLLCVSLTLLLLMFLSVLLSVSLSVLLFLLLLYNMISGAKGQKVVRACTIRLLNLGPAKHEKIAIDAVNQRISNV